jgi:hypothetical protein
VATLAEEDKHSSFPLPEFHKRLSNGTKKKMISEREI